MATAAPASPSRWLFGPAVDLLLGCGLLYTLVLAAFAWSGPTLRAQTPGYLLPLLGCW